jgi:hypothetical protein
MEKPVRILETEKIRGFNERVVNGLEHALNFMLGSEEDKKIEITNFEPFLMPVEAYLAAYKKQSVMIKIHSDKDYQGELYWFFEMKSAVVLGAQMRMMLPATIDEKLAKGTFDAADQDAFGELGNQLCGILDRAFRTLTRKDIHLRMDFEKKVYPHESIQVSSFRNEEEYVVLLANLKIPRYGNQKLTLLLPRSLYEVMLNLEVSLEGIKPKKLVLYTHQEALRESLQSKLNSRYTKVVCVQEPDELFKAIEGSDVAAAGIDLKPVSFPLSHQDSIFFKRLASNRLLAKLPYFLSWEKATEAEIKQINDLGLQRATTVPLRVGFAHWAQAFIQAPAAE